MTTKRKIVMKTPNLTKEYLGTVEVNAGKIFMIGKSQSLREAVSFVPGLGNGNYDVYGVSKYVPGYGERIVKVEIECITEEELRYLEKEHSDIPY